ncbi:hypothetical protein MAR_014164, partial [Mya arenaria]
CFFQDIVKQNIHLVGFVFCFWSDPRLSWSPEDYGDMESTVMSITDVWVPPIVLSNATTQGVYLLVIFIICSLETILTVVSCQIHSYKAKGYVPGPVGQKIAAFLAKLSLYRRAKDQPGNVVTPKEDDGNGSPKKKDLVQQEAWTEEAQNKHILYDYEEV